MHPTEGKELEPLCYKQLELNTYEGARRVVARRRAVGSTVGLSSWLDPHNRINIVRARASSWTGAEACAFDVAPVSPCNTKVLNARTALVNNEVRIEAGA